MKNLDDVKSLFFFMLAYWTWKRHRQSALPELFYVMPIDEIVKLVTIFGGRTLRVPTFGELSRDLKEALAAYMYYDMRLAHWEIRKRLQMDHDSYRGFRKNLDEWGKHFNVIFRKTPSVGRP